MDAVNKDILMMVFFMISSAGMAIAITDDQRSVVYVSMAVSIITCLMCFYLVSVR